MSNVILSDPQLKQLRMKLGINHLFSLTTVLTIVALLVSINFHLRETFWDKARQPTPLDAQKRKKRKMFILWHY